VDTALAEENAVSTRGRATAFARVALILSKVTDAQEATALARDAALRLGVDPTQLWIEAQRLQGSLRKPAPAPTPPSVPPAERDLLALLVQHADARAALLPILEGEDLSHPGLRSLLAALKEQATEPPEALMPRLPGEIERGLLAALLMEDRPWPDPGLLIAEYGKRYEIRRRLRQIRQVTQAIAQAQGAGDPALPWLEAQLRELQRQAEALREFALVSRRPAAEAARPSEGGA
jgi:hypothetical protein